MFIMAVVSFSNSKLGGAIPSINLPAGVTCRPDAPCFKDCYAMKGNFKFKTVKQSHIDNLNLYYKKPEEYFEEVLEKTKFSTYARYFSSGDIPDSYYFRKMVETAKINKNTRYLVFTQKGYIVNDYIANGGKTPTNLRIIFSYWYDWQQPNQYNFPTSNILQDGDSKGFVCPGKCNECLKCWHLKKGQKVLFKKH